MKLKMGSPFLYDDATGDIIGIRDADGGELLLNGVPTFGANGSSWVYSGGLLQSYVNAAGWTVTYTYDGGKVSTETFAKTGEATRTTTYTWSGDEIVSIVTR